MSAQHDTPDPMKALATLRARYALAGWSLLARPEGGFVAFRWGRAKELDSLEEAQRFLRNIIGGSP